MRLRSRVLAIAASFAFAATGAQAAVTISSARNKEHRLLGRSLRADGD